MAVASRTLSNAYQDSVKLMRVASDVADTHDVEEALAVMATDENRSMVVDAGLLDPDDLVELDPNDLLLVVEADDESTASAAIETMEESIRGTRPSNEADEGEGPAPLPQSLYSAKARLPEANLALISVPGEYAAREAWKALHEGLHVHVFSDNVAIDDERALKEYGRDTGQLVMGPDCGTAIVNGVPLGFANAVDRGSIGVVAAAGTGLQEVTSLIDRAGAGVSQAIGTGGRDLSSAVGGLTMRQGLERLADDPETDVVVLVSKPPDPAVRDDLLGAVEDCDKPVVATFVGSEPSAVEDVGATGADTLAGAARAAITARPDHPAETVRFDDGLDGFADPAEAGTIASRLGRPDTERTAVRGLFTGGTFTDEAVALLEAELGSVASNASSGEALPDPLSPRGHAVVDLGADEFTRGRPHPMIDPALRTDQLETALGGDEVLVVLLDVVLGYGAHEDPSSPILEAVSGTDADGWPAVVASVCGTRADPQDWAGQVSRLIDAGVHVAQTNADAARLAGALWAEAQASGGEP